MGLFNKNRVEAMKTNTHGGPGRGQGRKPKLIKRVPLSVLVLAETLDYLKTLPDSQGISIDKAVGLLKEFNDENNNK